MLLTKTSIHFLLENSDINAEAQRRGDAEKERNLFIAYKEALRPSYKQ